MGHVSFVLSNPRHHLEMMAPVVRELRRRGQGCRVVSLAELRGFATPAQGPGGIDVVRAIPIRPRSSPKAGAAALRRSWVRRRAQALVWTAGLAPRLRWLLRDSDLVVVPNDAVFPYRELIDALRSRTTPFALMQEGIRFPMPGVRLDMAYGRGGAAALCAWGEASAEHFIAAGVPSATVHVTGNPRFDDIDPAAWRARGAELRAQLGLERAPLLFLSNPIEDQGFGTADDKMALFGRFVAEAAPALRAAGRDLLVKLHMREDVAAFRATAAASPLAGHVHVLDDVPLFAAVGAAHAAVVMASTAGLEALVLGTPLGALHIPGHGFAFDYVARGAAIGLEVGNGLAAGVHALLAAGDAARPPAVDAYIERHIANRGRAARTVADHLLAARRPS